VYEIYIEFVYCNSCKLIDKLFLSLNNSGFELKVEILSELKYWMNPYDLGVTLTVCELYVGNGLV